MKEKEVVKSEFKAKENKAYYEIIRPGDRLAFKRKETLLKEGAFPDITAIHAEHEARVNTMMVRAAAKKHYEEFSSKEIRNVMNNLASGSSETARALQILNKYFE